MKKPQPWNGRCQRCGRESTSFTGSWFSGELICLSCSEIEEAHPDFDFAHDTETEAVRRGDYNFEGVGWPGPTGRVPRPHSVTDEEEDR